jgi:hypothetical protein
VIPGRVPCHLLLWNNNRVGVSLLQQTQHNVSRTISDVLLGSSASSEHGSILFWEGVKGDLSEKLKSY